MIYVSHKKIENPQNDRTHQSDDFEFLKFFKNKSCPESPDCGVWTTGKINYSWLPSGCWLIDNLLHFALELTEDERRRIINRLSLKDSLKLMISMVISRWHVIPMESRHGLTVADGKQSMTEEKVMKDWNRWMRWALWTTTRRKEQLRRLAIH